MERRHSQPGRSVARTGVQRSRTSSYHEREQVYDTDYDDEVTRVPRSAIRYNRRSPVYVVEETVQDEPDTRLSTYKDVTTSPGRSRNPPRYTANTATQGSRFTVPIRSQPLPYKERITEEIDIQAQPRVKLTSQREKRRPHWFIYVAAGMLLCMLAWLGCLQVANWWQVTQDDWHYGRPRTYQVDEVVGHHDSASNPSHFIALNMHGHIEVIEFPGGDASHAKVYPGPSIVGSGQDLVVVTLTFKPVNGNQGPDMILNVGNSHFTYKNVHGQFVPAKL